jgi:antitoxin ParD1/3/4
MQTTTKTIHISLPKSLIKSAKTQAEKGRFSNMSKYVRSLIREDIARREEQKLEQLLLEGVRSEPGIEIGSTEWKSCESASHHKRGKRSTMTKHETMARCYQTKGA